MCQCIDLSMRGPFETLVVATERALIPTQSRRMLASSETVSIFRWVVRSAMMRELFMIDLDSLVWRGSGFRN